MSTPSACPTCKSVHRVQLAISEAEQGRLLGRVHYSGSPEGEESVDISGSSPWHGEDLLKLFLQDKRVEKREGREERNWGRSKGERGRRKIIIRSFSDKNHEAC